MARISQAFDNLKSDKVKLSASVKDLEQTDGKLQNMLIENEKLKLTVAKQREELTRTNNSCCNIS